MSTAEINGSTVFYLDFGDAELPPLVLLHGLYGDSWSVAPLAERLAERFHVIAPDALGHGRSSRPEGFVLADQGRMLNGLVAALGYESTTLVASPWDRTWPNRPPSWSPPGLLTSCWS